VFACSGNDEQQPEQAPYMRSAAAELDRPAVHTESAGMTRPA
jgi:hypothetical protein